MSLVQVDLGDRSYPIHIGEDLFNRADLLKAHIGGRQACIVTNETVAPLYLEAVKKALDGLQVSVVVLPDGEAHKTLETLNLIFDRLLADKHHRGTTLIALGGGVVGDMTGFAAASYQRGVNFIQIPTTLLSQVDSSVGGKTGVNHPLGKNMIGAFHQPQLVLADTTVLRSLPKRELAAGLAEVIKYGLIMDSDFFNWLETNMSQLLALDEAALGYAIEVSCRCKAKIVAQDEKESGVRAWLNLGHTFGHAIETAQGYGNWLHGEAVAAGMAMAADLSRRIGWLSDDDVRRTDAILLQAGLPNRPPIMPEQQFLDLMAGDKKVVGGKLRLVLLKRIGEATVTDDFPPELLRETLGMAQGARG